MFYGFCTNTFNGCYPLFENQGDLTLTVLDSQFAAQSLLVPNPAQASVSLFDPKNEILQLEMYHISGKLLLRHSQVKEAIDVSNLSSGMYFVKLVGRDNTLIKKLIRY